MSDQFKISFGSQISILVRVQPVTVGGVCCAGRGFTYA